MRDFSGDVKENKAWELDLAKVVESNEGKCYVEVDEYHLLLDFDYAKIVKLAKKFVSSLKAFSVSDRATLLRSAFYRSLQSAHYFLTQVEIDHSNLVKALGEFFGRNGSVEEVASFCKGKFLMMKQALEEFKQDSEWCKATFSEAMRGTVEEGSEVGSEGYEIILGEINDILVPFVLELEDSLICASVLFSEAFEVLKNLEQVENSILETCEALGQIMDISELNPHAENYENLIALFDSLNHGNNELTQKLILKIYKCLPTNELQTELSKLQNEKVWRKKEKLSTRNEICMHQIQKIKSKVIPRMGRHVNRAKEALSNCEKYVQKVSNSLFPAPRSFASLDQTPLLPK